MRVYLFIYLNYAYTGHIVEEKKKKDTPLPEIWALYVNYV